MPYELNKNRFQEVRKNFLFCVSHKREGLFGFLKFCEQYSGPFNLSNLENVKDSCKKAAKN